MAFIVCLRKNTSSLSDVILWGYFPALSSLYQQGTGVENPVINLCKANFSHKPCQSGFQDQPFSGRTSACFEWSLRRRKCLITAICINSIKESHYGGHLSNPILRLFPDPDQLITPRAVAQLAGCFSLSAALVTITKVSGSVLTQTASQPQIVPQRVPH